MKGFFMGLKAAYCQTVDEINFLGLSRMENGTPIDEVTFSVKLRPDVIEFHDNHIYKEQI